MLKIGFINYSLNVGGIETLILEICKRIDRHSFEPYIFVFEKDGKLKEEYLKARVKVVEVPKRAEFDWFLPFRLSGALKKYNIDMAHTHNPSNWLYGGLAAKIAGIPLIHTEHTTADYNGWHVKRWNLIERLLSRITARITTVSGSARDYMVKSCAIDPSRIEVIHNAIKPGEFDIEADTLKIRESLSVAHDAVLFGNIARFYENKDHRTLLYAFKAVLDKNKNAYLLLAGDGPTYEDIKKLAVELEIAGNVRFLGNRRDIPQLLRAIDIFVLSSKREGLPIVILEAMASGLPVIATDVDGNKEAVVDGKTGILVHPAAWQALADAMNGLIDNRAAARAMGLAGKDRILSEFTFEKMIARYESIYSSLKYKDINICIAGEFPPPQGGMGLQAKLLADRLANEGFSVSTIKRNISFRGIFTYLNNIKIVRSFIRFPVYVFRLMVMVPRVNSIHIFSNSYLDFFLYTVPAVITGKGMGRKVIIHYHGGSAEEFLKKYSFFIKRIFRMADDVVAPSGFLKDIFNRYGIETRIIPNICDLDLFSFLPREKLSPNFIITRNLEKKYNVQCAVRAFRLVKERFSGARLTVVGGGSEESRLKLLARDLGVADSVFFTGRVDNSQVSMFYRSSDIFLNSSTVDNMPVSVLEAFASGLPVISADAGGLRYIVQDRKTGLLVNIDDHEGMAKSMCELLESPAMARDIALNAREFVKSFSWDKIRDRWLEIYAA